MIVNLFFEASTPRGSASRSRRSARRGYVSIAAQGSSVSKGDRWWHAEYAGRHAAECHRDAACIVGRAPFLARHLQIPIVKRAMERTNIDSGAARRAHDSRPAPTLEGFAWPSSATSHIAAWRARTCISSPSSASILCFADLPRFFRANSKNCSGREAGVRNDRSHTRRGCDHDVAGSAGTAARSADVGG